MKSSGMRTYRLCKMSMGRKENCLFDCIRLNSSSFALFIQIFHNREGVCKGICLFFLFLFTRLVLVKKTVISFMFSQQEQTDEEMAFSSAPPKKAEFGKETSKKKKGVLLYEDKDNISPAQKAKKDEQQRFKGIREIKGKV